MGGSTNRRPVNTEEGAPANKRNDAHVEECLPLRQNTTTQSTANGCTFENGAAQRATKDTRSRDFSHLNISPVHTAQTASVTATAAFAAPESATTTRHLQQGHFTSRYHH